MKLLKFLIVVLVIVSVSCKQKISQPVESMVDPVLPEFFGFILQSINYISEEPIIEGTDFYLYVKIIDKGIIYGIGNSKNKPENFDNYKPIDLPYEYYYDIAYFEGLNPAISTVMQKGSIGGRTPDINEAFIKFTEGTSYDNIEIKLKMIK